MSRYVAFCTEPLGAEVGVRVSGKEQRLKKHQARVPNRRTSAHEWQNHFGDERFDDKQQRGVEKYSERIDEKQRLGGGLA